VIEDSIFEPWSVEKAPPPSPEQLAPSPDVEWQRLGLGTGAHDMLRDIAISRLEAVGNRLRMARHATSLEDLLDDPERLIRFGLTPWFGPFSDSDSRRSAMLEFGLGGEGDEQVTAWYWLDRLAEAPHEAVRVVSSQLTASWVERVILDFVAKVLERS
jgi:hypothetical protein